jgi:glucose-1-phosphate thymidylyltransferase
MKAIIPVAGIGSQLRPHTHTQPKSLVPIAGKPIIVHIVDFLLQGGIRDFVFVIGYLGSKIKTYIREAYENQDLNISFVIQEPRMGIAHALYCVREEIRSADEIMVMLGDTIIELDLEKFLTSKNSIIGIKKVDKPGKFGVVELDEEGFVKKLVEKPKIPKSNLAMVGIYKATQPELLVEAVEYIVDNKIKTLGEYQLTDALSYMLKKGKKITTTIVDKWYDCGEKDNLLKANAILLSSREQVTNDHDFWNTIIIPPVSIGKDCEISNSIIGPNVAIGESSRVDYSIVRDSIIGSFSELKNTVLDNSVIGNDSSLYGFSQNLNIGDSTENNFS